MEEQAVSLGGKTLHPRQIRCILNLFDFSGHHWYDFEKYKRRKNYGIPH